VSAIQTADLDWQLVDGIDIPVSKQFGDVYFSKDNGLLETRHVFLNGNDLAPRLAELEDHDYFCVGETGFGTGLNILALWQLWQQVRPNNHSRLHAISVEKFPLTKADLIRALNVWPELQPLAEQLIAQYPLPIAGCHRLNFPEERFSIDLWLGDAHDVFPAMEKTTQVNAWFLDGFAPSCNPDMWEDKVLNNIVRLSDIGTTFSSFSVAGVLKRGLKQHGISISRPRGFGHKREMLKAIWQEHTVIQPDLESQSESHSEKKKPTLKTKPYMRHIAVIGAGIAGLSTAWAFASRGHKVSIVEQTTPLSGGSGNPLALLNPKLCPIEQSAEHLMTLAWQHAMRHYGGFKAYRPMQVKQYALKKPETLLNLATEYPIGILDQTAIEQQQPETAYPSLELLYAGAVSPHQLRDEILQHPHISYQQATVTGIQPSDIGIVIQMNNTNVLHADHVVVCCALENAQFFENYPVLKPIRGQVSWFETPHLLADATAYSYGGYAAKLNGQQMILGASFYPGRADREILEEDHVHNFNLIHSVMPNYAQQLPPIDTWQGRASVRAQSQDYFPLLGKLKEQQEIYSFAGLGSKGFLFAPLCAEILAAQILNEACPVPSSLVKKLSATRFQKKMKAKKPYFKPQI
jgi:tRNA 5-methylaminomethyl-2-thiouridine biosynthesis bifunctional protein